MYLANCSKKMNSNTRFCIYFQTKMQRQFNHEADDFTLEKIIEYGFDQYAETINEISGAATKELAIELVRPIMSI